MVSDNLPEIKGWLKMYTIDSQGNRSVIVDQKNALVANSRKIMVHSLTGDITYKIDTIEVVKAGSVIATSPSLISTFPIDNKSVSFTTRFDEASFNDTFDEIRLTSSSGGQFSVVTGLSVNKTNTLKLEVEWVLTINNI